MLFRSLSEFSNKDGKIHTNYVQTGTTTGRISSKKPNLQNIPQESHWAKALRSSFESESGKSFVSFDYSQLELRLLAHLSKDDSLRTVFKNGLDVHSSTAARVFNVSKNSVTKSMRRVGKTLNFEIGRASCRERV